MTKAPIRGLRALATVLAASLLAMPVMGHAKVVATPKASVFLVDALSVEMKMNMDFGNVIVATGGGTIVMNPAITPSCTVTGGIIKSGVCQPAVFGGAGEDDQKIRIKLPPGAQMTVSNGTGASMIIDQMTVDGAPDTDIIRENPRQYRLTITEDSGIYFFRVGGRLTVSAGQAPGTYTGTFSVDVTYN